jgi:hypothetical protein
MKKNFAQRVLGAVDIAIEFATLGEYGLEPLPADGPCRERSGHRAAVEAPCKTGWEAFAAARSRGCDARVSRSERVRLRDLA